MKVGLGDNRVRIASLVPKRAISRIVIVATILGALTVLFRDGLTKNWADLEAGARDPALRPIVRPEPRDEAVTAVAAIIDHLPRWKVEAADPASGTLHATRKTRLWQFVDDIHLKFEPTPEGCRITGHSQSRIGKGDLGQNARNLKELVQALGRNSDARRGDSR